MKHKKMIAAGIIWSAILAFPGGGAPAVEDARTPLSLWYGKPAAKWLEALPVGNGRLGGMIYGGVPDERIQLNEDTLWSGAPTNWDNPQAREVLPEIRRLIFAGKYAEAHQLGKKMMGPYTQSYLPMGNLYVRFDHGEAYEGYRRELSLDTAIATVSYSSKGVRYTREIFASHPDQVIVIHLTASRPGSLNFSAGLDSKLRFRTFARSDTLVLRGKAPMHVDPSYYNRENPVRYAESDTGEGMNFECRLRAITVGGTKAISGSGVSVRAADEATLLLSAATSFNGFDRSPGLQGKDPGPISSGYLSAAAGKSYEQLRRTHVEDHQALFRRVELELGEAPAGAADLPTDERVARFGANDPQLVSLHFQYGRYLLISSSRPGTQPPNLQGIWNDEIRPPWSSNWTLNINAEMNMWPAEVCNLAECHEPLIELIRELAANGRKTAQVNYGAGGWVAHHNTDIWRQSAPVGDWGQGDSTWALWPMAGPWLCHHLWEHYEFSGDKEFLRNTAYPLIKGAAEFCLDFLIEDGKGHLVTAPSTSPENRFLAPDGQESAVSMATTMDMSLIRDLFAHGIEASAELGVDPEFRERLRKSVERLLPFQLGAGGRLQEWDRDFKDVEPHHRHLSHLWSLYPGNQITKRLTPELFAAARRSLEIRSDEGTGWSSGWKISLWARLGEGDLALGLIRRTLRLGDGGVYPNLFGSHPPFQMDGNFAFPAGIAEMLIQSHEGELHLLPSLPTSWQAGRVRGLRARGGFEVDMSWAKGKLASATIHSKLGRRCSVRLGDARVQLETAAGGVYRFDGALKSR